MTLVLDASAVIPVIRSKYGFKFFGKRELIAPACMWTEVRSVIRGATWRGEISEDIELELMTRLERGPIKLRATKEQRERATEIARYLGWAKIYDTEYLALAKIKNATVVTNDQRLVRGSRNIAPTITLAELNR